MSKRANGEGNIRRRKDGKWLVTFPTGIYKADGKREYVYKYTNTQAEASEILRQQHLEISCLAKPWAALYSPGVGILRSNRTLAISTGAYPFPASSNISRTLGAVSSSGVIRPLSRIFHLHNATEKGFDSSVIHGQSKKAIFYQCRGNTRAKVWQRYSILDIRFAAGQIVCGGAVDSAGNEADRMDVRRNGGAVYDQ